LSEWERAFIVQLKEAFSRPSHPGGGINDLSALPVET
jgi:hypothetical protein